MKMKKLNLEEIKLHSRQKDSSDDDVLDDISEKALTTNTPVYVVDSEKLPEGSAVAALRILDNGAPHSMRLLENFSPKFLESFGVAAIPKQIAS